MSHSLKAISSGLAPALVVVCLGGVSIPAPVSAASTYQVVYDEAASWDQAAAAAERAGRHLVWINSEDEQRLVERVIAESRPAHEGSFWIGLRQVKEGRFAWNGGEALGFSHWDAREPDNAFGSEDRVQLLWSDSASRRGRWNDVRAEGLMSFESCDVDRMGYVIEIEGSVAGSSTGEAPADRLLLERVLAPARTAVLAE